MALLSRSLVVDTDHDLRALLRYVSVALPPLVMDRYAGVYVYHRCPSRPNERCGFRKYGCVKSRRRPRSSDDHLAWTPADRAPPKKFRWWYSESTRAFSSVPYPTPKLTRW